MMRHVVVALLISAVACAVAVVLFVSSTSPRPPAENLTLDARSDEAALASRADERAASQAQSEAGRDRSSEPTTADRARDDMTAKRDTDAVTAAPKNEVAPAPAIATSDSAGGAGKGEVTVGQKNKEFTAKALTLKAGEKIKFVNNDTVAHNVIVTAPDRKLRNSGVQEPGQSATMQFDEGGNYDVECAIHPQMRMTVEVK